MAKWQEQNNDKITKIIKKAKDGYNGLLVPEVDHKTAKFGYRILREMGEEYDVSFLDNLSQVGIFEKFINNKFLVCPEHKSSFLLTVRINCPKCNSINVEKLSLLEHKTCGYISEKKHFEKLDNGELKCPSCKKQIKYQEKELRLPASWYFCKDCSEKFDEAKVSLHCNEFDHDFTALQASSVELYNYVLSDLTQKSSIDQDKLKEEISKILTKHGYSVNENYTTKGKSGLDHSVDIVGIDGAGQSVFIFMNNSDESNSEIDSRLIQILDTSPKIAILIGFSSISEKTKSIASKYNLSIISSQNIEEITAEIQKIVSAKTKKSDGGKNT
ncbi:MAG: hypothetical protein HZC29_06950 [Thaumarchaeota archaeon]|nr:hypothetical protein [Nitrososphaerota archaeon]